MQDLHGLSKTRLYRIWKDMYRRCYSSDRADYLSYGGRGIKVADDWHNFRAFAVWALSNGYNTTLTLDRIDNDGPYSPENCRWVSWQAQFNNRRSSKHITAFGETKTLLDWSQDQRCSVTYGALKHRLQYGWSAEHAITAQPWARSDRNAG